MKLNNGLFFQVQLFQKSATVVWRGKSLHYLCGYFSFRYQSLKANTSGIAKWCSGRVGQILCHHCGWVYHTMYHGDLKNLGWGGLKNKSSKIAEWRCFPSHQGRNCVPATLSAHFRVEFPDLHLSTLLSLAGSSKCSENRRPRYDL